MLSYMLPVEEKPPPGPKGHLQLTLTHQNHNGRSHTTNGNSENHNGMVNGKSATIVTPISKETSVSSFISDTTATASHSSMTPTSTSTDRSKTRMSINGKHQSLKRVSFGSSKGSMVETLIFESPLQEEPEPSPIPENGNSLTNGCDKEDEREKVRVTFFQQSKPQEVDLPDDPPFCDHEFIMSSPVMKNDISNHVQYYRTESTESGWDNPFRPGGDLSREADQIVELIKGGKPITPTPGSQAPSLLNGDDSLGPNHAGDTVDALSPKKTAALNASPNQAKTNGTTEKTAAPGQVDIQRSTIKAEGADAQVEHVTIKKKKGCNCCVIS